MIYGMRNWQVVKIYNPDKYPYSRRYGILVDSFKETAVINFNSNKEGLCISISHDDYGIVSPDYWEIWDGEIVIKPYGGYIVTGLKIYT